MPNKIYFISAVTDFELYNRLVCQNEFVKNNKQIECVSFDNSRDNQFISKRYNQFLNNYDYSQEAWFVFSHSDWELLEDIEPKLIPLDMDRLWGPVGSKLVRHGNLFTREAKGGIFQKKRDGSQTLSPYISSICTGENVDTFDCQCLIAHSSLVKTNNLRFDERLAWDLYVEDFCIYAFLNYNVKSSIVTIKCCHWSDMGFGIALPKTYEQAVEYLNNKYDGYLFAGCCSVIGHVEGIIEASSRDSIFDILRKLHKDNIRSHKMDLST